MKKWNLFWALLTMITVSALADTKDITVTGVLTDAETKEKVEMAAVQLFELKDSTLAAGVTSKENGRFVLPKVKPGKYELKVSYLGYQTVSMPLTLSGSRKWVDLGQVDMHSDAVMLKEAVIVAEVPPVTIKEDTMEYAASAYRVAEGAMLEDLVKKIPGIEVDESGNIKLNGKDIKKIMVDGKEFFSDDPKMAMKNLPAEMVDKVRAYDRQSDMARITGIDDGEEEPVLDLSVKPHMKKGWLGNFVGGYGSDNRYEVDAMVSSFKDDSSISVIAASNNTNNRGFSEFGNGGYEYDDLFDDAGSGITTSHSLGVNFSKDTRKLSVHGNVQYGYSDNDARSWTDSETFLGDNSSFGTSQVWKNRKRHDARTDIHLEWRPDSMTTLVFEPKAHYSHTKMLGMNKSTTSNNEHALINRNFANSYSTGNSVGVDGKFMISRKLGKKGRNITVGAKFGYSDQNSDGYSDSEIDFFLNPLEVSDPWSQDILADSSSVTSRFTDRNSDSRNWSVNASYTEPVFKHHFLQFRYEFAHRKQFSQSLVYDSVKIYPDYLDRGYDGLLSTELENFYDSHTARVALRGVYSKMKYSVGVGIMPQSSLSNNIIGVNADKKLPEQKVVNWAPKVVLEYMFSKQHMLMIRYNGRSTEPNIENLQEVIDISDPMNLRYGNPNLKPSFRNSLIVYYRKFEPKKMRSYSLSMYYQNTVNAVANRMTYDMETGARAFYKENVNGNWSLYTNFNFNTPFKNKKFTFSTSTTARMSDAVSYTMVGRERMGEQVLSTTHNWMLNEKLTGGYRCDAFDVSLNASVNYNLVKNNRQTNSNRQTFDYYVGGNTNINLPWQIALSTDVDCRFKRGYSAAFGNSEVLWNAQISKSFLKNNAASIRFKIYDILHQQSNLSRTISETMMSDTEYNTLGSYFMVHFVYRFNTLGGKSGGDRNQKSKYGSRYRYGDRYRNYHRSY